MTKSSGSASRTSPERPSACRACGGPLEQSGKGRPRIYCSAICRSRGVELDKPGNHAKHMRKYRKSPGNRGGANNRKHRYGVTSEEFDEAAAGGCQACGSELKLALDHDHACCPPQRACKDCWRGVLCTDCNFVLGRVKDSRERLLALVAYLDAWEAKKALRSPESVV